jgi:hypothetical protein
MAVSGLIGVVGPLASVWLVHRFGPIVPTMGMVAIGGLVNHVLVRSTDTLIFSAMVLVQPVLNLGTYALHMGVAAVLDRQGRLTTACGGAFLASYALAPVVAGYAAPGSGVSGMLWTLFGFTAVDIAALWALTSSIRRSLAVPQPPISTMNPPA